MPGRARSAVYDNTLSCKFVLGSVPAAQNQASDFRFWASDSATLAAGTLGLLGSSGFWSWVWLAAMDSPFQVMHAQLCLEAGQAEAKL